MKRRYVYLGTDGNGGTFNGYVFAESMLEAAREIQKRTHSTLKIEVDACNDKSEIGNVDS